MTKILKSFGFALNGLKTVWKEELNFRLEVIASAVVAFCLYYFSFSLPQILICIIAITIILSSEIINTVIEDLCNKIEPKQDPLIGKIKDMSSSFVLVAGLGSFIVIALIFYYHLFG